MSPQPHRLLRAILVAGLLIPARGQPDASIPSENELERGRRLFELHCASCHGPRGEGGKGPTLAQPILPRASNPESLRKIIRDGISGTEMPGARFDRSDVPYVAAFVRALGSLPPERVPGDAGRGAQLYRGKGGCVQCHTLDGHGGALGPDLSAIGRSRSAAYLRRALIEPGADVPQSYTAFRADVSLPQNYLFARAVPRTGDPIGGVRVNEDTFSVQIRDVTGRVHSLLKSDLLDLQKDRAISPMPSYATVFTAAELDDMIAFLVSRRGRKDSSPELPLVEP
jgi:cytochrome c oxidase cbb3-type subunit 3